MYITPQRRQRMVRAHYLRQGGHSLSQSAEILNVSRATIHADLKLLETHWNLVAELTHDDLLLEQIEQLQLRVNRLRSLGPLDLLAELGLPKDLRVDISEMTRLYAVHQQAIQAATRELRLLLRELRPETRQRFGDVIDIELADDADQHLMDPEQGWTTLNKPEHPKPVNSGKTQDLLLPDSDTKKVPERSASPIPRNTGRNKPCPCGSNKKRKHCHPEPQSLQAQSPPPGDLATHPQQPDVSSSASLR